MIAEDDSTLKSAKYSSFNVHNEMSGYRLHVSGLFSGNIESGDKFRYHKETIQGGGS